MTLAALMDMWVPGIGLALLLTACAFDLRTRLIPDWIPLLMVAWGGLATALGWGGLTWIEMLGGMGLGFGSGVLLYWAGMRLYGEREGEDGETAPPFGGGDVKLLAGVGAIVGLYGVLPVVVAMAIIGGLLAAVAVARGKRDFAYAPAIALGMAAYLVFLEFGIDAA